MERRVVLDNAATDGIASGGVRARTMLAEASVGRGLVGAASGGRRDAQSSYNDVMAEERLVGGAALRTVLLYSGRCCCGSCGGGAQICSVGAGADVSEGRTAVL